MTVARNSEEKKQARIRAFTESGVIFMRRRIAETMKSVHKELSKASGANLEPLDFTSSIEYLFWAEKALVRLRRMNAIIFAQLVQTSSPKDCGCVKIDLKDCQTWGTDFSSCPVHKG